MLGPTGTSFCQLLHVCCRTQTHLAGLAAAWAAPACLPPPAAVAAGSCCSLSALAALPRFFDARLSPLERPVSPLLSG